MSKMRGRKAPSPEEQELNQQLVIAEQALLRAATACQRIGKQDRIVGRRALQASRNIHAAINSIGEIGNMVPNIDSSDPDMMSEKQRIALFREIRNARLEKHKKTRLRRSE